MQTVAPAVSIWMRRKFQVRIGAEVRMIVCQLIRMNQWIYRSPLPFPLAPFPFLSSPTPTRPPSPPPATKPSPTASPLVAQSQSTSLRRHPEQPSTSSCYIFLRGFGVNDFARLHHRIWVLRHAWNPWNTPRSGYCYNPLNVSSFVHGVVWSLGPLPAGHWPLTNRRARCFCLCTSFGFCLLFERWKQ